MPERCILAMGGGGFSTEPNNPLLDDYLLSLVDGELPRVCFIPTASGDASDYVVRFYAAFNQKACRPTHLSLINREERDLEAFIFAQDAIYVGGGNTAIMLAAWRLHGLDKVLIRAWERGIVLAGLSAGSLCWFQGGTTDSFGPDLSALADGLGILPGSNCPHYDSEPRRRPAYHQFIAEGLLQPGIAADDGVAIRYSGQDIVEIVSSRPKAGAYRVERTPSGTKETPLPVRYLGHVP